MTPGFAIEPVAQDLRSSLQAKVDQKTKPIGSLGRLENLAIQVGLIQKNLCPRLIQPTLLIFAGDHGITESGVSAYPQSVTAQMVANILRGGAAISVFADQHGLALYVVDAGVKAELTKHPRMIDKKIAKGTANFLHHPAMSKSDCRSALNAGADIIAQLHQTGCNTVGFGEMGIGNTSSAALLVHCLTGVTLDQCVGRGAGLSDSQLRCKHDVLRDALAKHGAANDPLEVLATYGGYEIAMMVGGFLKAAELGMLILIDGFIASAALLAAFKISAHVQDYCVFSHTSSEAGHRALLTYLDAQPLLNLDLRLGEGSGVALVYPLIESAVLFLNEMATFDEAGVDNKTGG